MESIVEYLFASTVKDDVDVSVIDRGLKNLRERWFILFGVQKQEEEE